MITRYRLGIPPWDATPAPEGQPLYEGCVMVTLDFHYRMRMRHALLQAVGVRNEQRHYHAPLLEETLARRVFLVTETRQCRYTLTEEPRR